MIQSGKTIHFISGINIDNLEKRPYELKMSAKGEIFLKEAIPFSFEKLHGKVGEYPALVSSLVASSKKKNIGFLYEGTSGMGKTVTIRNTCIELGLPVIIIKSPFSGSTLKEVAEEVGCDVIFFFDEFEKIYKGHEDKIDSLLGFFDGFPHPHKVISLCSFNSSEGLSNYFFNRPGRFLLQFNYEGLSVEDALSYLSTIVDIPEEYKVRVTHFISSLYTITYDVMSTFARLIKAHGIETVVKISPHLNFEVGACDHEYGVYIKGVEVTATQTSSDNNSPRMWYGGYQMKFRGWALENELEERYENISVIDKEPTKFSAKELLDDGVIEFNESLLFVYNHQVESFKEPITFASWKKSYADKGVSNLQILTDHEFEIRIKAVKMKRTFEKVFAL